MLVIQTEPHVPDVTLRKLEPKKTIKNERLNKNNLITKFNQTKILKKKQKSFFRKGWHYPPVKNGNDPLRIKRLEKTKKERKKCSAE